jgi:uncharacterized protein YndB with AHSA1/START domain
VQGHGTCREDVAAPEGIHTAAASGTYTEIIPNEKLAFTWRGDWAVDEESLVTLHFKEVEGGTELLLIHERIATAESMKGFETGWNSTLTKLAALCEA